MEVDNIELGSPVAFGPNQTERFLRSIDFDLDLEGTVFRVEHRRSGVVKRIGRENVRSWELPKEVEARYKKDREMKDKRVEVKK